jgi:hypothetical protein
MRKRQNEANFRSCSIECDGNDEQLGQRSVDVGSRRRPDGSETKVAT